MEPRFGQDFGDVRVHSDQHAAQSATDVNAKAYTVGNDIVFGAGQYQPGSSAGDRLIAHELAHTVQQNSILTRQQTQNAPTVSRDIVVPIAFPDYLISTPAGRVSQLGHAGVLIVRGSDGFTAYFEYGRYDRAGRGLVRRWRIPNVQIGTDGRPTQRSLQRTLQSISNQAGQGGRILAAEIEVPGQFTSMYN